MECHGSRKEIRVEPAEIQIRVVMAKIYRRFVRSHNIQSRSVGPVYLRLILDFDQAHVPAVVSALPHTSSCVSSCADGQLLVSTSSSHLPYTTAVVNSIYVPPPCAPSSVVSRQVSAVVKRPIVSPYAVLDPLAPSFQPHVTQLDSTSSVYSNPTASLGVVADSLSSVDSVPQLTTFAPSMHLSVPYIHPEPDEPKPPDITPSEFDDGALVMSVDAPAIRDDPEVLGPKQEPFDEDGDLDVPRHLLGFFDRVVDQGGLDDDEQDELAAILRTYALMSQVH